MEAVGVVLSGFELKRSRGDPIHAPGRFTVSTLFLLLFNKKIFFLYNKKIFLLHNKKIFLLCNKKIFLLYKKKIFLLNNKRNRVETVNLPGA